MPFPSAARQNTASLEERIQQALSVMGVDIRDLMDLPMSASIKARCYNHQNTFIVINRGIELRYDTMKKRMASNKVKARTLLPEEVAALMHAKKMPQPNGFIPTAEGLVFYKDYPTKFSHMSQHALRKAEVPGKKQGGLIVEGRVFDTIEACADHFKIPRPAVYCIIKRHGYEIPRSRFDYYVDKQLAKSSLERGESIPS